MTTLPADLPIHAIHSSYSVGVLLRIGILASAASLRCCVSVVVGAQAVIQRSACVVLE
ncbi:hypothetical protein BU24DRAFT_190361 [Aaosphaeria arxii CBS 175.79]|uniref:Uncharacterized protein n=1 Tax=Aaosphaeria arxii CBS 175.79 TaxID=1450172 RepID=A0A6A5XT82_9PLEO|nr:uncharacterized protein BU24DRAFT_190361 [Aaosphaeria arxii CBS 175.79]KAF2016027.1 hypothetical protein BU24DRAFT_190361 [Aaosphaeria arxii CBS 175.79]